MSWFVVEVNGIEYVSESDAAVRCNGRAKNPPEDVVVREFLEMKGRRIIVQGIGKRNFTSWHKNLTQVLVPKLVSEIRSSSFQKCESLCTIIFESGSNLEKIDSHAFYACALKSVRIPGKVELIGESCFFLCRSLCAIIFESGSNLKEIGSYAFYDCALKSIRIPGKVELIGECCFSLGGSRCEIIFESGSNLKGMDTKFVLQMLFIGASSTGSRFLRIPKM
jgi:hypothetical protein